MKYKFRKQSYSGSKPLIYEYGVEVSDKSILALEKIEWHGWTPNEVEMIIEKSKALQGEEEFKYQVPGSDFLMLIDKEEVYFYDMQNDQEEEDFKWRFDEFISFMEEFKKFIKENR